MFVCYRRGSSLLPQKSFRRSGTSSPVQCLSTPFRRLNGSRTPPSGEVYQWCVQWALGGLVPCSPQTAASQTCRFGSNNPATAAAAEATGIQGCIPASVPPHLYNSSASMSFQRRSRVGGRVLWLPQGQSQLLQ